MQTATAVPARRGLAPGLAIRYDLGETDLSFCQKPSEARVAICSMTGYASVSGETDAAAWRWEAKSVNGRGLDVKLRLPPDFSFMEQELRGAAQKRLSRGNVNLVLSVEPVASDRRAEPDPAEVDRLVAALVAVRDACEARGLAVGPVTGETVAVAPPLLNARSDAPPDLESLAGPIRHGFEEALEALCAARAAEGAHAGATVLEHLSRIESLLAEAETEAGAAIDVLRERLRRQVAELLDATVAPSEERLEQEIAILSTRADVREELDRLRAHIAAAQDLLSGEGPHGRRLDFLTQEFNREANTLCSKSATTALTRIGLDLKATIDRLKEQAANVE